MSEMSDKYKKIIMSVFNIQENADAINSNDYYKFFSNLPASYAAPIIDVFKKAGLDILSYLKGSKIENDVHLMYHYDDIVNALTVKEVTLYLNSGAETYTSLPISVFMDRCNATNTKFDVTIDAILDDRACNLFKSSNITFGVSVFTDGTGLNCHLYIGDVQYREFTNRFMTNNDADLVTIVQESFKDILEKDYIKETIIELIQYKILGIV